jgi:tetratricopeptide (TPR) repeat protein
MHPSMALLPTAEDAATAFAEVFFAIKLLDTQHGPNALAKLLTAMHDGASDRVAVEKLTGKRWPDFERAWMASLKQQPYPKELLPTSSKDKKELAEASESKGAKKPKRREISFDFVEIVEPEARRDAHLGELMRERKHMVAAAEFYERAYGVAKDRYESLSNKLALTWLELKRFDEARTVLEKSLAVHPGSAQTSVHLARVAIRQKRWPEVVRALKDAVAVTPFDPEVHVGLYVAGRALGDAELTARAEKAVTKLTGLDSSQLPVLAARLAEDASLAGLEVEPSDAGADAGR